MSQLNERSHLTHEKSTFLNDKSGFLNDKSGITLPQVQESVNNRRSVGY